ncbi:hypothetical protein Syun_012824 [Stephania yunnanensis]|uniref:Cytochrome P450 n=1 Tax=Stephania yunnanensis TaxID=152371 RepID=A0AAP0PHX9_9MAGN
MDLVVPILYALIFLLTIISINLFRRSPHKNLPPGPRPWPLLGNLPTIFTSKTPPHLTFTNLARTHGGLMLLWFGHKPVVFVSNKAAATEVLKTHDRALSGRHVPASFHFPEKLQTSLVWSDCDAYWKQVRRVLRTEVFCPTMLRAQEGVREEKVRELVEFVRSKEGKAVTIRPVVFGTILNVLGNAVFSRDLYDLGGRGDVVGLELLIRELLVIGATPDLADYYKILDGWDPQRLKKEALVRLDKVDKLWEPIVEERKRERKLNDNNKVAECMDMLDVLLDNNYNDAEINSIFLETFGPGSESSSATAEWVMSELIKNPTVLARLRQELDNEFGHSKVTGSHRLAKLPYLSAVIKEVMRLHPAIPFMLPHKAVETCQVLGYTIPKGFQVQLNAYAIGREPEAWPEPNTFRPERFLESDIDYQGNHFELVPFGAGRRICPGMPLAMKNTPFIVSTLVHEFDWNIPGDTPPEKLEMNEQLSIALTKDPPLCLIPKLRRVVS